MAKLIKTLQQIPPQIIQLGLAAHADPQFTMSIPFRDFRQTLIFRDAFYNGRIFLSKLPKETLFGHFQQALNGLNALSITRVTRPDFDKAMATDGFFSLRIYPTMERYQCEAFDALSEALANIHIPEGIASQLSGQAPTAQPLTIPRYEPKNLPDHSPTAISLADLHNIQDNPTLKVENETLRIDFTPSNYADKFMASYRKFNTAYGDDNLPVAKAHYNLMRIALPKCSFTTPPSLPHGLAEVLLPNTEHYIIEHNAFDDFHNLWLRS